MSTPRRAGLFAGLLVALSLVGCQQPPPPPPVPGEIARTGTVLQTVNGQAITQDMLDTMIKQLPEQLRAQLEATGQIGQLSEQLVIQEILYQKAVEAKMHEDPDVKQTLGITARSALADAMLRKEIETRLTDAAIQKWYDDHAVQFARPQVELAHVMVATEDEAKAVKAELEGGADFAAVAKAKSLDTRTAAEGGVLGWVRPKDIGPLGAAVENLDAGGLAGPVQSAQAWHVLKVLGKRDKVPLDEVKDQIKEQVKGDIAEAYIKELKEGATIVDGAGGASVTPPEAGAAPATPPAGGAAPAAPSGGH
ncbi:peptidyl-prolyl cis-trans isomerase [Myxococcota bacterium]|nr:peptidyl-prolyl cis-trans isomerase [Myxococcota bacterium]